MTPSWFLTGVLLTLSVIILLLPWLRTIPNLGSLPAFPWPVGAAALATIAVIVGVYHWPSHPQQASPPHAEIAAAPARPAPAAAANADTWADIANNLGARGNSMAGDPAAKAGAQPMSAALASLQRRLANGGGSADDWELLAKSYEFLGRPAEAAKARAHQLPPLPGDNEVSPATSPGQIPAATATAPAPSVVVRGEVSLAPALSAKASGAETLFIVAKAVDSPGPPVAVLRTTAGRWPVKFELSDAQSMLPGRNLSSATRVRIEARLSRSGQPLPAPGDLQGSTGPINPADGKPLRIVIEKEIE